MTALLVRAVEAFSVRSRPARSPLLDSCSPDCVYEYLCDAQNRYYRRQCCYQANCEWVCGDWVKIRDNC
jgi:hypothetical protein